MFAAVDLGSNSFRLHIGYHDAGAIHVIKTARDPVRLAAGLDKDDFLSEESMQTGIECLRRFGELLSAYPLQAVRVVATNTLRVAKNAADFLRRAEKAIGYPIEIISGEEEGRLIYMGVAGKIARDDERRLVIDIGGGSTELILGIGQAIERVESFSVGTFRQNRDFFGDGIIDRARFDAAVLSARSYFEDAASFYTPTHWNCAYGSSGTIRAIGDAIARNGLGDGRFSLKSLEALAGRLVEFGHVSHISLAGMKPDRAGVITGGLAIIAGAMQEIGIAELIPVEAGLRMGVLWDLELRGTKRDRRERSVHEFAQRFRVDMPRAGRVAESASALFAELKPESDAYARYLYWSAFLHETGMAVSQSGFHKHGAYILENADLPGFTGREQKLIATLILGQKGNLRKLGNALTDPDFAKALLALRIALLFMHAKLDGEARMLRIRMKNRIEAEIHGALINSHPTIGYLLDKERGWWHEVGVEFMLKATT